jgi:ABC-type antimicrobial peptide transport system permease subunit
MDSSIVLTAFLLALFMGVIGGLIPAFYATKIKITEGLRSV